VSKISESAKGQDCTVRLSGWHEQRFTFSPIKVHKNCLACGRDLYFPPSKADNRNTCGKECNAVLNLRIRKERERNCLHCNATFIPRASQLRDGQGLYCSSKCSTIHIGQLYTPEAVVKRSANLKQAIADGMYVPLSGESNPLWMGGPSAYRKRRIASGAAAKAIREYRKNNPHKVREFNQRRKSKSVGRLPNGTVEKIGNAQNWKCPICTVSIKDKYHVDHVLPVAKGGKHVPLNIQLLCPDCNLRKSAKDPIDYMQSRGFLL